MDIAVVILNWNGREFLERFLPGLLRSVEFFNSSRGTSEFGSPAEVVVADNASTDGSMEMMAERFPEVRTIVFDRNYGFTGGYNRAFNQIDCKYFLLLNSDIEVPENWLGPLVDWMESHPICGVCAPKLKSWQDRSSFEYAGAAGGYIDRYGYPFCRGRVLSKLEKDNGQYDSPADVFWVSGACLLVRSEIYRALGGLDDRFFAHMEEIDFCWRAQLQGWRVSVVPESVVWHIGGGTLPQNSPFKLYLNYRNNLLMLDNNLAETLLSRRRAGRVIRTRMILDGCSALVYLMTLRPKYFMAVVRAHRDWRKMRLLPGHTSEAAFGRPVVSGMVVSGTVVPGTVIPGTAVSGTMVSGTEVMAAGQVSTEERFPMGRGVAIRGMYDGWMIPRALLGRKIEVK